MLTIARVPWVPSLGIEYHLAADGISLTLLLLTGIIAITGVLFSWDIEDRAKEFFALFLLLIGAVYGVFLSYDLFLLFVFYEIVIIPKYFLIAIWGSTRREYGAMKLALYSFAGSAMVLIGLIAAYVAAGARSTSLGDLAGFPFSLALSDGGVSAGICRLRGARRHVAVAHLGADRPRCRAHGGLHAACRRGDEAGRLRMPARGHDAVSAWPWAVGLPCDGPWLVARCLRPARGHRDSSMARWSRWCSRTSNSSSAIRASATWDSSCLA